MPNAGFLPKPVGTVLVRAFEVVFIEILLDPLGDGRREGLLQARLPEPLNQGRESLRREGHQGAEFVAEEVEGDLCATRPQCLDDAPWKRARRTSCVPHEPPEADPIEAFERDDTRFAVRKERGKEALEIFGCCPVAGCLAQDGKRVHIVHGLGHLVQSTPPRAR